MFAPIKALVYLTFVCATAAFPAEESLEKRQVPNFSAYIDASVKQLGLSGQGAALLASPITRAICPSQASTLQNCFSTYLSLCTEELYALEWCWYHRSGELNCGGKIGEATKQCIGSTKTNCINALTTLHTCSVGVTVPPVPPP